MDLEKLTDRARGFLQAAQTIAVRAHHQRIVPAHLLKALLDDEQGMAAGLIGAAGGDASGGAARGRCADRQDPRRDRRRRDLRRRRSTATPSACSTRPQTDRDQGRRSICHGRAHPAGDGAGQGERCRRGARQGRRHRARRSTPRSNGCAAGAPPTRQASEDRYDALKRFTRDLTAAGARRQARPGDRPRRGNSPDDPGARAADQE